MSRPSFRISALCCVSALCVLLGGCVGEEDSGDQASSAAGADMSAGALQLRENLRSLHAAHVRLTADAARNTVESDPNLAASATVLDKNSIDLAGVIGGVYGDEVENRFLMMWRGHIASLVDYGIARKVNDRRGMDKAATDLSTFTGTVSGFLAGLNPNLPREGLEARMREYVASLREAVDAHAAGDDVTARAKETEALAQITRIADALASAIAKQYPEKY